MGSEFYALFSSEKTTLSNVIVTNPAPVSSFYLQSASLIADNLVVGANTGTASTGGAITCMDCDQVGVSNSFISGQKA
jgi:hypothetical protein